jgi:hypothetical protein
MRKLIIVLLNLAVYLFALLYVLPIVWTIFSSFKDEADLFSWPPKLISQPTLVNYLQVVRKTQFALFFRNSFLVSVSATLITIIISVMGGYALAKYQFRFKNQVSTFILSMLMIPLQVIMVPIYLVMSRCQDRWGERDQDLLQNHSAFDAAFDRSPRGPVFHLALERFPLAFDRGRFAQALHDTTRPGTLCGRTHRSVGSSAGDDRAFDDTRSDRLHRPSEVFRQGHHHGCDQVREDV